MRPWIKRWIIIIVVLAGVLGLWAYYKSRPIVVETVQPTRGDVREFVLEDGKTRLDREYLVTMPIDGRVRRIRLDEGDFVTSGSVLARIDDFDVVKSIEKLRAEIASLRSQIRGVDISRPKPQDIEAARLKVDEAKLLLESSDREIEVAKINLANAEREFRRMEKLLAQGIVQRAQYDTAKLAYDTARENLTSAQIARKAREKALDIARVNYERIRESVDDNEYQRQIHQAQIEQVESQIAVLQDQLEKTTIPAPIDGVVLEKLVESERVLGAGTALLRIGDLESIEVETDILSEEIGQVREGQTALLSGKALQGRIIEGRVARIYPTGFKKISALGIEQQRVKVIIEFDNSAAGLRPNVSVDVSIVVGAHENVPTVPEQSIFKESDRWSVLVVANGRLERRPVEIGLRNDRLAEITKGLSENDAVVLDPTNEMRPGMRAVSAPRPI